jgi:hypothetical protein
LSGQRSRKAKTVKPSHTAGTLCAINFGHLETTGSGGIRAITKKFEIVVAFFMATCYNKKSLI